MKQKYCKDFDYRETGLESAFQECFLRDTAVKSPTYKPFPEYHVLWGLWALPMLVSHLEHWCILENGKENIRCLGLEKWPQQPNIWEAHVFPTVMQMTNASIQRRERSVGMHMVGKGLLQGIQALAKEKRRRRFQAGKAAHIRSGCDSSQWFLSTYSVAGTGCQ